MGVESFSTGEYSSKATNHSLIFARAISSSSLRDREREKAKNTQIQSNLGLEILF
ncbi:BnaC03g72680D [Brassica napus]|uniref:BnaC03g72680D protein n=1 Tax=Brassica napus TaxID=3708 RepID=A0A078JNH9_BRANA|nr:BnaC03g72680D [Brassica napus]